MDIRIIKFFLEVKKLYWNIIDNKKQKLNFLEVTNFDKVDVHNAK